MIGLSQRMCRVPTSATVNASMKAEAVRRSGMNVISLAAGEPDFDTPLHIREAAKAALDSGKTRYVLPAGLLELREAIARKLERENGLAYSVSEISVGCGAKQSLMATMMATLDPGDEVILPAPYWVSHRDIPRICGARTVTISCPQENGFKLTASQLDDAITARTKWLILCSPSNPSGAVYSIDELSSLAEVLRNHPHVGIVMDHIYENIVYDGIVSQPIQSVAADLHERTLLLNGLSKGYCMTGWRVGYIAGPQKVITAVNALQSQSISSTATFSQWGAMAALDGDNSFMTRNIAAYLRRRDFVVSALNEQPLLSCAVPDGAFYAFPSCAETINRVTPEGKRIESDDDFADYLLTCGVAVVPGSAFGLSPHFRISYAASEEDLREACRRIAAACQALDAPQQKQAR